MDGGRDTNRIEGRRGADSVTTATTPATTSRRGAASAYLPPWLARIPPHVRALVVLLVVALLLWLWPIAGVSLDYDEGVYWQSLRAMAAGHPLFTSVFSSQPPFFLLSLYPFYLLFGQTLEAARLGVAIYSLVGVLGLYAIGRMLGGRWAGVAAAAMLAVEPIYLIESHSLQAEAPSLAFAIVCVALALASRKAAGRARLAFAAASGVFLSLGLLTKLSDVVAVLPAVLYLIPWGDSPRPRDLALALRRVLPALGCFALGALVGLVAVLAPFAAHLGVVYDQVVRFHTIAAQANNAGLVSNIKELAGATQQYPLWLLALVAIVLALRRRAWVVLPPLLWLLATVALLLDQQPLFGHHLALLSPPLALLAALSAPLALQTFAGGPLHFARVTPPALPRIVPLLLVAVVLVVGLAQVAKSDRSYAQGPTALQTQEAAALQGFSLPGDLVATDDQYIAGLADRSVLPQLVDTSIVRVTSGYLTAPQIEALLTHADTRVVLFASGRFNDIHGFHTWVTSHYSLVTTFPDGGALYLKSSPGLPIT
jgi:4-amino-4-deoxy-L-arabinose transferase-like glycosyltransferase